jgi:hypothetical protein
MWPPAYAGGHSFVQSLVPVPHLLLRPLAERRGDTDEVERGDTMNMPLAIT